MNFKNFELYSKKTFHNSSIIDLSSYTLEIEDYQNLFEILKESQNLEELILPKIPEENFNAVIKLLNKATKTNTSLQKISLKLLSKKTKITKLSNTKLQQINSRLTRNRRKIFGIHGGGNIGLCLMAHVASHSPKGFKIIATSSDQLARSIINSKNQLHFIHKENEEATTVKNLFMVDRDQEQIIQLYQDAVMLAICVTPDIMQNIATDVALGLLKRYETDRSGLKILVLMNKPNCSEYVYETVFKTLLQLTNEDFEYAKKILSAVDFVPTVIDRIVTKLPEEAVKAQIKAEVKKMLSPSQVHHRKNLKSLEHAKDLEEKANSIISYPQELQNLLASTEHKIPLFKAEKNFSFYVPQDFKESVHFPLLKTTNNIKLLEDLKNKCINGTHAILAWLGALHGCETIAASMLHPQISLFISDLLENEIKPILLAEYSSIDPQHLDSICEEFLERCRESTDDPVTRVGRDPLRKLNKGARIRGLIELSQKNFMRIILEKIEFGIAAGIVYALKDLDPTNKSCVKIKEIFEGNSGDLKAVLCYVGEAPCGDFIGFDPVRDLLVIERIVEKIRILETEFDERKIKKEPAKDVCCGKPLSKFGCNNELDFGKEKDDADLSSFDLAGAFHQMKFDEKDFFEYGK